MATSKNPCLQCIYHHAHCIENQIIDYKSSSVCVNCQDRVKYWKGLHDPYYENKREYNDAPIDSELELIEIEDLFSDLASFYPVGADSVTGTPFRIPKKENAYRARNH